MGVKYKIKHKSGLFFSAEEKKKSIKKNSGDLIIPIVFSLMNKEKKLVSPEKALSEKVVLWFRLDWPPTTNDRSPPPLSQQGILAVKCGMQECSLRFFS